MHIAVQLFRAVKLTHAVLSLPLAYLPTACCQHLTADKSLSTLAFFDPISSAPLALLRVDRSQSRKVRFSNHIELVERLSTLRKHGPAHGLSLSWQKLPELTPQSRPGHRGISRHYPVGSCSNGALRSRNLRVVPDVFPEGGFAGGGVDKAFHDFHPCGEGMLGEDEGHVEQV
ncbi:hypothetical protein BKA58DRAFT_238493 [Alternaria rosae]|uniref:uncharacterized protein n=1 Tax=Alternaria rosae TaxID=1187941 RepID=UPI001E8E8E2B|nr:uncharacterized protein BKA58DRAFT_238493 [Alternaria rosae]KAH6865073.1 hypothetical protein BKA58DRAFT_238493 [Alternaria rosae]